MDNPLDITGISLLTNKANLDHKINCDEIERAISGKPRLSTPKQSEKFDAANEYNNLLQGFETGGGGGDDRDKDDDSGSESGDEDGSGSDDNESGDDSSNDGDGEDVGGDIDFGDDEINKYLTGNPEELGEAGGDDLEGYFSGNGNGNTAGGLMEVTNEERRQHKINEVMEELGGADSLDFNLEKEKEEDTKTFLLEEIDAIKTELDELQIDTSRIPVVTANNRLKDIEDVYKFCLHKYNRQRYSSLADEFIITGAYALTQVFNGRRKVFGYTPDLTGWHNTVSAKLTKMRYETANLVGGIMREYNVGIFTRMMLELVPSAFLHTKRRHEAKQAKLKAKTQNESYDIHQSLLQINKLRENPNF